MRLRKAIEITMRNIYRTRDSDTLVRGQSLFVSRDLQSAKNWKESKITLISLNEIDRNRFLEQIESIKPNK